MTGDSLCLGCVAKDLTTVNNNLPFYSISAASSFLNINAATITSLLNSNIASGTGYYFFDFAI